MLCVCDLRDKVGCHLPVELHIPYSKHSSFLPLLLLLIASHVDTNFRQYSALVCVYVCVIYKYKGSHVVDHMYSNIIWCMWLMAKPVVL